MKEEEKWYVKMCEDARGKYFVRCDPPEQSKPREWELLGTGHGTVSYGWQLQFGERVKVVEKL